jgi:hypothetical protein
MQFPTVEECNFARQFLFDEYVAIFHRYDLERVSLKSQITVLSSYVKIELFSNVYDARQPVELPQRFFRHPVQLNCITFTICTMY